ncbi:MAG: hypothetical protein ACD_66C00065G0001 [uncultured bacterium]|uniref:Lycopene cyclase domain-containing protein n=1 Tax=Candidatus Uhrbacteria bacterium GW2011_GWC1_41_20 TaxID=1618983 RepID=A0A0G0YI00_9BACT|nr:MAG: hypothetical protein ACD_66C00065G0001 [uncultured bacterium]KKR23237.1 MAG: hypothetical protein UT52_C0001G0030 [Candidatus Uhrbacteria bacterium GW2011_GWE1_39_46]KKR64419.1 MAG: hypothetical protein UU04_C0002G0030 [Candidatus Uhrbacteria bacterium GW2011_GWC2_40_450]KKR89760.1 MAG: hypothetical protein UU36_C0018G0003 [Candidatus Uhrbacteria bacterium GW2011_GWE2_41_1153]KKR90702.1 MAG: hypothetical protein UU40_C0001G0040 [Candidatus Uhrbacteria bacterium GW2011_GWD2_41_121]KKR96
MEVLSYYSVMTLILALTWILIFLAKPDVRREILLISVLGVALLPIWFTTQISTGFNMMADFSSIRLLDLMFLFSVSGISATIFHVFFGKHYQNIPKIKSAKNKDAIAQWWATRLFLSFLFFIWVTILLASFFKIPMAYSILISAIMLVIYMISHRQDLLADSILSAILTAFIVLLASNLGSLFTHTTPVIPFINSGTYFYGISADLLCWALALGLVLGPLYEFTRRKLLS